MNSFIFTLQVQITLLLASLSLNREDTRSARLRKEILRVTSRTSCLRG